MGCSRTNRGFLRQTCGRDPGLWRHGPLYIGRHQRIHTLETTFRYIGALSLGYVHGTTNNIGDAEKDELLLNRAWKMEKEWLKPYVKTIHEYN